jgi:hypothetical protein
LRLCFHCLLFEVMFLLFVIWGYVFIVCFLRLCFYCLLFEVMFLLFVIWGYVFIVCYFRLCFYCLLFEVMFLLFVIFGYVFVVCYLSLCFYFFDNWKKIILVTASILNGGHNCERDPPKDHSCQVWFNLVLQFQI